MAACKMWIFCGGGQAFAGVMTGRMDLGKGRVALTKGQGWRRMGTGWVVDSRLIMRIMSNRFLAAAGREEVGKRKKNYDYL